MPDLLQRLRTPSDAAPIAFPRPRRVLYAVNHSLPYSSNGYAMRTHGVAVALARVGLDIIAVSRPGWPWHRPDGPAPDITLEHRLDGVRYLHLPRPSPSTLTPPEYLAQAATAWEQLLRVFKPQAVLAASNWQNALPAALAAHQTGRPFFYEVRGFWELSRAAREPTWAKTPDYTTEVVHETAVTQAAQRVFTLNRLMSDELQRRGLALDRIDLVPNGVPQATPPATTTNVSRTALGIQARRVLGYLGSFNAYEGLEDLIVAVAQLRQQGQDIALLLVGSATGAGGRALALDTCPLSAAYRALAKRHGLGDRLVFTGRVPPEQTSAYYALMDLVVIPRRPLSVCELVSPMKPLEAAAHGKRVVLSNVAPLADLEGLCPNFSYFEKGDINALARALAEQLAALDVNDAPILCPKLAELTWERNIAPMVKAFCH